VRETWAAELAALTGFLALTLSIVFAFIQNPAGPQSPAPRAGVERNFEAEFDRGREVFEVSGCARCHSVAGQGNPRSPLDGVAERLTDDEIRNWIVGAPELKEALPPRAFAAKQSFQQLNPGDFEALVAFLIAATSEEDAPSNEQPE
jgi:mono/diheme cytochrome c family protein